MKTRTLLLLAVLAGTAILVAGTVQLLRISRSEVPAAALKVGETGRAGDAELTIETVTVDTDADGTVQRVAVQLTVAGVDDDNGFDDIRLVGVGATEPIAANVDSSTCTSFRVAEQSCLLVFEPAGLSSTSIQLLWTRADDRVRWALD